MFLSKLFKEKGLFSHIALINHKILLEKFFLIYGDYRLLFAMEKMYCLIRL